MFIYNSWPYFLRKRLVSSCHHFLKRRSRILKKAYFSTFGSFWRVQNFFSKNVFIMCSSTTHHLLFCENRLFLSCTVFSHGVLEKKFWARKRYKKKNKNNKSFVNIVNHMYKLTQVFLPLRGRKMERRFAPLLFVRQLLFFFIIILLLPTLQLVGLLTNF